ncbi:MAG: hypothetical protein K8F92_01300 [Hyphomicrobium sp.]|uniref:hypothetical protein n=1 Tax=Hyphomicrobium sp. TaxID=82 RepID=UPI0013241B5B|nr:hypothetical protein [Hyphomicrobium sp.]KAB2940092.1 MAG: hypothetical protein F9K20_14680 [Hyphomicrobium sp.]MBZ0208277.1 hypothetical protein [Hyphomicrobium sp.]
MTTKPSTTRPPAFAWWIMKVAAPACYRGEWLEAFLEDYSNKYQAEGMRAAHWWAYSQAIRSVWHIGLLHFGMILVARLIG